MEIKLGECLRYGLAGPGPRLILDMRGGAEASRWQLKEDGKEKMSKKWENCDA